MHLASISLPLEHMSGILSEAALTDMSGNWFSLGR